MLVDRQGVKIIVEVVDVVDAAGPVNATGREATQGHEAGAVEDAIVPGPVTTAVTASDPVTIAVTAPGPAALEAGTAEGPGPRAEAVAIRRVGMTNHKKQCLMYIN
jgi:hypothetical protein